MTERVAFFIPSFERGGIELNVINLTQGLIKQGIEVDIVLSRSHPDALPKLRQQGRLVWVGQSWLVRLMTLPARFMPFRLRISTSAFWGLVCYLRRERPKALVSTQAHPFAVLAWRLARVPTKLIIREAATVSASTLTETGRLSRLAFRLKRRVYPQADVLVANSHGAARDLEAILRLPGESVRVVYNPTVTDALVKQSKQPLKHSWFLPGQPPVVLGVGRLTSQKDFETLIRAFGLVRKQMPARLIIIGEGDQRQRLKGLIKQLKLEKDVKLPGFLVNPHPYMTRSKVFVLSSKWEGLPNVLIEALALGIPVVATDCPSGPREVLVDGLGGLLVPVSGVQAMAVAVLRILQDRQLGQNLVDAGKRHLDRFRPEAGVKQWVEIIRETPGAAG